jgi:hypothetical protein
MNTERTFWLFAGLTLIIIGGISLLATLTLGELAWRMWPIIVILLGLGLCIPGFGGAKKRWMGSFFMPGVPILVTGGLLLVTSLSGDWGLWGVLWTLIVIAVGLGFALSGFFMRVAALGIPAAILMINGLFLLVCAATGAWALWAVMFPIVPLSVGVGLLVLGLANRSSGVRLAANILIGIAGGGFFITSFFSGIAEGWLSLLVPGMLILSGILLAASFAGKKEDEQKDEEIAVEETGEEK